MPPPTPGFTVSLILEGLARGMDQKMLPKRLRFTPDFQLHELMDLNIIKPTKIEMFDSEHLGRKLLVLALFLS